MDRGSDGLEPINLYALVSYIPDPLGGFLDRLRRELVPRCIPHAHVSVLPPRPLAGKPAVAREHIGSLIREFAPFTAQAGAVQVFPVTDVVYLIVEAGSRELREMHKALNTGPLAFQESFSYVPHITLAQGLAADEAKDAYELASRRWMEFPHKRGFTLETVAFVQNTKQETWMDLAEFSLGAVTPAR